MAAYTEVTIDDPQLVIDTFGAGARLRWEHSEDAGLTWLEGGTETVVATIRKVVIEYRAGDDDTLFRTRYSSASPATADDFSAYSDIRPVTVDALVATPGSATASSYLTVAAADVLAADDIGPEPDKWLGADRREKAAALKRATREIDSYVATGWPAYSDDQALVFPRETDLDGAGDPMIPRKVVLATYQQAIYILKNKDALGAMNAHRSRQGDVDPDASYGVDPNNGPSIISPMALHYLAGFRVAPRAGKGGGIGSVRVASGFVGTW